MKGTYNELQQIIDQYLATEEVELVHRAYLFAKSAHSKQIRKSGEPYIIHPISVATILAELKMPKNVIISALLHDVVEDTEYKSVDIENYFGSDVTHIVEGVTKLGTIKGYTKDQMQSENHRKILMSAAKDIRVLLVKLADRLHNMQTINYMNKEKQKIISDETLEVYAPIAHRLGMYELKWELEDLSFKCLNHNAYVEIAKNLEIKREQRETVVEKTIKQINELLSENSIVCKVIGRSKHIYSIYKKMEVKNLDFDELTDLFAFRIIVDTIPECYTILGILHDKYKPIPDRFKDYIPTPKHNLYQSIHTTVITSYGIPMEFQIRTKEMDIVAENGIAAHWMYKGDQSHSELQQGAFNKLRWLNEIDAINNITNNSRDFMNSLQNDIFTKTLIVYTPDGDVIELPEKSNVLDFAFYIHSDVGFYALSGKVNDNIVSLFYPLSIGDVVTIITSKHSNPTLEWINKVTTTRAKESLKKYFKDSQKKNIQNEGKSLFIDYGKHNQVSNIKEIIESEEFYKIMSEFNIGVKDEFFYLLGVGEIDFEDVIKFMKSEDVKVRAPLTDIIISTNDEELQYKRCTYCYPLPGDEIVAVKKEERYNSKYIIHQVSCHLNKNSVECKWTDNLFATYATRILLEFNDKVDSLLSIIKVISERRINISGMYARGNIAKLGICRLTIDIQDKKTLDSLINELDYLDVVYYIERKNEYEEQFENN